MGWYLPAKAALAQTLLNRAWAATRDDNRAAVKPWPWADTWPVARLHLPGESAPLTVLAGASGRNLAFAPTLLDGSAEPGTPGVTVIAGHRDTHFRALEKLALGDEFTLERPDGVTLRYAVAALDVIDVERDVLRLDADESVVALVTCWPFDAVTPGGPERYVVTGVPVGAPAQSAQRVAQHARIDRTPRARRVCAERGRARAPCRRPPRRARRATSGTSVPGIALVMPHLLYQRGVVARGLRHEWPYHLRLLANLGGRRQQRAHERDDLLALRRVREIRGRGVQVEELAVHAMRCWNSMASAPIACAARSISGSQIVTASISRFASAVGIFDSGFSGTTVTSSIDMPTVPSILCR